jgi:hypothetical protein
MKITMPGTVEEAVEHLGALGKLISATKWERAAIIAMLVGPPTGRTGRPSADKSLDLATFPYTPQTLADVGIHGLRSRATVEHHRNQWCNNRPVPQPGEEVDLDELGEWTGTTTVQKREERAAPPTPEAITAAMKSDPKAMKAAREVVVQAEEEKAKALIRSVGGDPDTEVAIPDPVPRVKRLLDRIWEDTIVLKTEIGSLRRNGQPHLADRVLHDLREILASALAELTEVPDSPEGIER